MARYFFQARRHGAVMTDDIGEEFVTLNEAEAHATIVARELGRNNAEAVVVFVLRQDENILARCGAFTFADPLFVHHDQQGVLGRA